MAIALTWLIFTLDKSNFFYDLSMFETLRALFGIGDDYTVYKFLGWSFILALLFCNVFYVKNAEEDEPLFLGYFKFLMRRLIWMWMFTALICAILTFAPVVLIFLSILAAPFLSMIPAIIVHEKKDFFSAFANSFSLGKGAYGDSLGSFAIFLLIFFIFKFALENPIEGFFGEFDIISLIDNLVKEITITVFDSYQEILNFINSLIYVIFFFVIFSIYALSFSFSYYSSNEMKTAKGMYERLEKFGRRNKHFETEVDYD